MNAGDSFEVAWEFADENAVGLPILLDTDETAYRSYTRTEHTDDFAPFPVQVVIDREGVVRYLSFQHDPDAVIATIDALIAE